MTEKKYDALTSTNPKDAIGSQKLPLHLWPTTATALGCLGLLEGREKYGRQNYRAGNGVIASIYIDACKRHLDAWFEGEECAPDSGLPHLANALASLAIIVDARAHGKLIDDRAFTPSPGYRALVDEITPHVARIKKLFEDKQPKHYTISDSTAPVVCKEITCSIDMNSGETGQSVCWVDGKVVSYSEYQEALMRQLGGK